MVWLFAASVVSAQTPLSNLVFTVGTTTVNGSGQNWSYVLLGSPQPEILVGKKFAVYGKDGAATNNSAFTLRGTLFRQTDVAGITTLLNQSISLGQDLGKLQSTMLTVLHRYPASTNQTLAQNILLAFQMMRTDAGVSQSMALASGANPGLTLCLGQSFAEQITGTVTYEIRDANIAGGAAGDIVGRVTIVPSAPTILPAPGAPFQVTTNSPTDDLRIRLRWGQPDALLRLSLLNYGFNLWRIPRAAAEIAGYNTTPPTTGQLTSDTRFTRANTAPVMATKYFPANGANDSTDGTTYFFADGRLFGQSPFADGDEFYYFITARDVLGRDGLVSPGGLAEACRHSVPLPPTNVKVVNTVQMTNQQRLLISWQQNTNTADGVTEYWVYRWPNPSAALTNDSAPLSNRVGVVPQAVGTNINQFIDPAISVAGLGSYWYSVRAVDVGQCGPLLSAPTPPVWGVLRERSAPLAATGTISGSCGTPVVMFQTLNNLANATGPDTNNWNYRLTCLRREPGIAWVQFYVTNHLTTVSEIIGPLYFPPGGDTAQFDFSTLMNGTNYAVDIGCVVGSEYGQLSQQAVCHFTAMPDPATRQEAVFFSGQLLATALSATDPLLTFLNGGPIGSSFVPGTNLKVNPSGTVSMRFNTVVLPALIEVFSNSTWVDLGVFTPDSNHVYWVSYPACLLGPMPPFRGALVNVPTESDCLQHISRGADGGPVAPIHVRFGLTPGTHEYRLYRTVDDGPLSLLSAEAALYDSNNPGNQIVRTDDAMPASPARLGYFIQMLDEHGHGSPIAHLGYRYVKPAKLPQPVLSQPAAAGTTANPQATLTWFCPSAGINRFAIKIARVDQPGSGKSTGMFAQFLLKSLPTYNKSAGYFGLFSRPLEILRFDEEQLTPPIGTNFGPGPSFSMTVSVTANVPYAISVAAVDAQGNEGDASLAWNFTWVPPILPQNVPWPARPPAPVTGFDDHSTNISRVAAVLLLNSNTLDNAYPVGIRIGSMAQFTNSLFNITVGTTNFAQMAEGGASLDPTQFLFRRLSTDPTKRGDALLPIAVYRQQVTNAIFPRVSGNVVQVTPLIERIPWIFTSHLGTHFPPTATIPDLLIATGSEPGTNFLAFQPPLSSYSYIYLRDTQPVINLATYQYYVVRFNAKHEIAEVIDAGQVTIFRTLTPFQQPPG